MSIGPTLPPHLAHLLQPQPTPTPATSSPNVSVGPQIPANDDDDDDDYVPALPPHLATARQSKPLAGPSLPSGPTSSGPSRPAGPSFPEEDDDSDDDVYGPVPVPTNGQAEEEAYDPVKEFMEREERRRKEAEEESKPKVMKREEWMLVPPTSGVLSSVDPLRKRPSTFSRSTAERQTDSSVWTETPVEKAQRLADELAGVKRKKGRGGERVVTEEEELEERRKRRREEDIRGELDQYNRGPSLLESHQESLKKKPKNDDDAPAIWDHARDMGITGRLLSDQERNQKIKEARGLGDRFGHGKGGAFQM